MTTARMTDKQRRALEAMETARSQGLSLTEYARVQGLVVRELYDALAALRRRGVLPKSGRKARSKFVAVQVASPVAVASPGMQRSDGSGVLCRIVHVRGHVIECSQWPPPSWVAALSSESTDAAP
jgi:hypothetical protein